MFGYSKELSHLDGSFECQQHMFWLRNKNIIILINHCYLEVWLKTWSVAEQMPLDNIKC